MTEYHVPIMVKEVVEGLQVEPGKVFVDGTVGGGGHSLAIVQAGGRVIGIDQDAEALEASSVKLEAYSEGMKLEAGHSALRPDGLVTQARMRSWKLAKGNFRDLESLVQSEGIDGVDGVLLDLGVSSHQLDEPKRGFRFDSSVLDMRMDQTGNGLSAAQFLAQLGEVDLEQLLRDWGEERYARRFARAIVAARRLGPIERADQLRDIIWQVSPPDYRRGSIDPATRTFQALRLAVNDELGSLLAVLPQAKALLKPGGRLVVLSFHSLEDRIVKQFMKVEMTMLTKTPLRASVDEVAKNPRARSAKLRVAEKEQGAISNEQ